ncbi:MAG: hypothetical protein WCD19_09905, partial [Nitrososphaeraceae archaeon]
MAIRDQLYTIFVRTFVQQCEQLGALPIPNANQSKGQDGVLGMAFDPAFNKTHHIYVAYTYEQNSGGGV